MAKTFVCYKDMETSRADYWRYTPHCPKCREPMIPITDQVSIPKKTRKKWKEFFEWLGKANPGYYIDQVMKGDRYVPREDA